MRAPGAVAARAHPARFHSESISVAAERAHLRGSRAHVTACLANGDATRPRVEPGVLGQLGEALGCQHPKASTTACGSAPADVLTAESNWSAVGSENVGRPSEQGQALESLERLEPTSARRDRRQRAVRLTVHAPPDGNRLSMEKVLPMALAHRRIRHLPKRDARRALTRMNPSPVRRERRGVRGQPATRRTAGSGNPRGHRTATLLRPRGNATKFAITDLHDWFEHRRCPNFHTLGVERTSRAVGARSKPRRRWPRRLVVVSFCTRSTGVGS